jgi:hydroxylamine reductase (hybrid-cluster protein)
MERNNTEAFIKKICDAAFEKFVMREVWKDGASGARAKFRKAWMTLQCEKAEKGLKRRWKSATKKKQLAFKLATTNLELDISEINSMTSLLLKDQLQVYRDILKDPILVKILWKDMKTAAEQKKLVLEAREREIARRFAAHFELTRRL